MFRLGVPMNWITWSLLSAGFAALTALFAKLGVEGISSHLATAIRTSVVLVISWGMVALTRSGSGLGSISQRTWLWLILSGLATGGSWLCYFRALQLGPASQVAPIDKLSVVFVVVLAALFLGEAITWRSAAGVGLMVGGALLLAGK
jgi:bacterial/archaeal transporter family protein